MRYIGLVLLLWLQTRVPIEVEKAEATLAQKPDNPQANLIVGKHHLQQGDADKAVPYLLKGSDNTLKSVAKSEEGAADKTGAKLVAVGDEWVNAGGKGPLRQACVDRASWWYAKAWLDLDVYGKLKLLQRLNVLYAGPRAAPRTGYGRGWNGAGGRLVSDRVHSGSYALCTIPPRLPDPAFTGHNSVLRAAEFFVEPNKACVFTCWVLTEGTDAAEDVVRLFVGSKDFSRPPVKHECPVPRDFPIWTKLSIPFTPEEEARVRINLCLLSQKGKIYLDDVSVKMDGKELVKNGGFEE